MGHTHMVRVSDPGMSFSAAHFVITSDGLEPLHGHNYAVSVEITSQLCHDGMVVDFRHVKRIVRSICGELDHRILLAERSQAMKIRVSDSEVQVHYQNRHYVFPRSDCVLLPIEATTAELLAQYIADRMKHAIQEASGCPAGEYLVCVGETPQCQGCAHTSWFAQQEAQRSGRAPMTTTSK